MILLIFGATLNILNGEFFILWFLPFVIDELSLMDHLSNFLHLAIQILNLHTYFESSMVDVEEVYVQAVIERYMVIVFDLFDFNQLPDSAFSRSAKVLKRIYFVDHLLLLLIRLSYLFDCRRPQKRLLNALNYGVLHHYLLGRAAHVFRVIYIVLLAQFEKHLLSFALWHPEKIWHSLLMGYEFHI